MIAFGNALTLYILVNKYANKYVKLLVNYC